MYNNFENFISMNFYVNFGFISQNLHFYVSDFSVFLSYIVS